MSKNALYLQAILGLLVFVADSAYTSGLGNQTSNARPAEPDGKPKALK